MDTSEMFSKLTVKSQIYTGTGRNYSETTWQDVLQSMQGIDPGKTAFMFYIYGGDSSSRHDFWAGLFIEAMLRPVVQDWSRERHQEGYHGPVKALCNLAVDEWKTGFYTHEARAAAMGVSRATWNRKYRNIYQYIFSIPGFWQDEVDRIILKRLR